MRPSSGERAASPRGTCRAYVHARVRASDGHLPEVISAASERGAIAYLTDHGRRVAATVPADDAWYWTPEWQAAEAEADTDFRDGRARRFDSMDDLFAESDAVRGETSD